MMSNKWGILVTTAMVVVTSLACGGGGDVDVDVDVTPSPAQQKQMMMDNAHAMGETIFEFAADQTTQYALYCGTTHIIFLKPRITRTVKLTSNETINLSVRKRVGDDWNVAYSFQNLSPGDYVRYDEYGWRVTPYTP